MTVQIDDQSRQLFMKYAIPCGSTLVSRGSITQKELDLLRELVKRGEELPADAEKIFKVAFSACSLLAIDKGKDLIDNDIIHDYFLQGHDFMIDKRFSEMMDFDPQACRVRPGIVESVGNGFASVIIEGELKKFRTDFLPHVKAGDNVITHWDYIVENAAKDKESSGVVQ